MAKKDKTTFDLLLSIKNRTVSLRRDVDTIRRRFADENNEVERHDASQAIGFVMSELADLNESCGRMLELLQSRGVETSALYVLLAENAVAQAENLSDSLSDTGGLRLVDDDTEVQD